MASKASAVWTGSLKEGKGTISTATGVLKDANYSFATRFEGASSGTTPEEMIAAAHASCFSMALGAQLGGAGLTPNKIETEAAVKLTRNEGLKANCPTLSGSIGPTLANAAVDRFSEDDYEFLKFHGIYQRMTATSVRPASSIFSWCAAGCRAEWFTRSIT